MKYANIPQAAEQRRQGAAASGMAAAGMVIGSQPAPAESEIEREVSRLNRADLQLAQAVEMLWDRLSRAGVLSPPEPAEEPTDGTVIEAARSSLGSELQESALSIERKTERLHHLMRSLCL